MTAQSSPRLDEATIERARSAQSLVGLVARRVQLRRAGRGWSGLCPFHKERTPSFTVSDEKQFYHCFGCGAHGDAIRWIEEAEGLSFREAVMSLLGGELPSTRKPLPEPREIEKPGHHDFVSSSTAGRWIWRSSSPARGEIVERYLEARGLDPRAEFLGPAMLVDGGYSAIDQLRFHARCPVGLWKVSEHPDDHWLTAPAMVAPIGDAEGAIRGVRVTFLSPDGRGLARLPLARGRERPTRKIFGKLGGFATFLTPVDLIKGGAPHTNPAPPLIVAEGLETAWAFAQGFGRSCRVAAALSLENMQGGAVKLRDGSLPLWDVRADPERPPFTIPNAGEVVIAIDADMKPLNDQKVQEAKGARPIRRRISPLERAEICASLAAQAWRRAGAGSVRCVRPKMGMDFNDQIRSAA